MEEANLTDHHIDDPIDHHIDNQVLPRPNRRRCRRLSPAWIACTVVTCLIVIVIGVIIFYCLVVVKRQVDFVPIGSSVDKHHIQFDRSGIVAPLVITMDAVNMNYYDINIVSMNLWAGNPLYQGALVTGHLTGLVLYKRTRGMLVNLNLNITYLFTGDPEQAFLRAMNENCTAVPPRGIYLEANINVHYSMFIKSGYVPMQRGFTWSCDDLNGALSSM